MKTENRFPKGTLSVTRDLSRVTAWAEVDGVIRLVFDTGRSHFNPLPAIDLVAGDPTPASPEVLTALRERGFPWWSEPFSQSEAVLLLALWEEFSQAQGGTPPVKAARAAYAARAAQAA